MKKTYKTPGILVVQIRTNHMLAESLLFQSGTINSEGEVLTREYDNTNSSGKNVWEDEW